MIEKKSFVLWFSKVNSPFYFKKMQFANFYKKMAKNMIFVTYLASWKTLKCIFPQETNNFPWSTPNIICPLTQMEQMVQVINVLRSKKLLQVLAGNIWQDFVHLASNPPEQNQKNQLFGPFIREKAWFWRKTIFYLANLTFLGRNVQRIPGVYLLSVEIRSFAFGSRK